MGSSKYLGFSTRLMTTLGECRGKVESWVEREKQEADEMEREYRQSLSQEQSTIDSLEEDLLALKFKLGIDIKKESGRQGNSDTSSSTGGIAERQRDLLLEKERLQAEIERLKQERDESVAN